MSDDQDDLVGVAYDREHEYSGFDEEPMPANWLIEYQRMLEQLIRKERV